MFVVIVQNDVGLFSTSNGDKIYGPFPTEKAALEFRNTYCDEYDIITELLSPGEIAN